MSKPNLLFYANKLGGREIGLIFFAHYYKKQGFCETFVEILGIDIKGDVKWI